MSLKDSTTGYDWYADLGARGVITDEIFEAMKNYYGVLPEYIGVGMTSVGFKSTQFDPGKKFATDAHLAWEKFQQEQQQVG